MGPPRSVSIVEDCAGLATGSKALKEALSQFHIDALHESACSEQDKTLRKYLKNNTDYKVHKDMRRRPDKRRSSDHKTTIYVCGFNCQPYSHQGLGQGERDPRDLKSYVQSKVAAEEPDIFLLENVKNLVSSLHLDSFKKFISGFKKLKDGRNRPLYKVKWIVLNSRTHGQVPHNRNRLYVVGIKASKMVQKFRWPKAKPTVMLSKFIKKPVNAKCNDKPRTKTEKRNCKMALKKVKKSIGKASKSGSDLHVVDSHASKSFGLSCQKEKIPCLTRTRGKASAFMLMRKKSNDARKFWYRRFTTKELWSLQGWPGPVVQSLDTSMFKNDSEIGAALGNGFTYSVVKRIMVRLLVSLGYQGK